MGNISFAHDFGLTMEMSRMQLNMCQSEGKMQVKIKDLEVISILMSEQKGQDERFRCRKT